jgi:hypothetical protein
LRETSAFAGFIGQPSFIGQPMNGLHSSADKTEALIAEQWHLKSTDEMQSVVGKIRIACETQCDGIPTEATWPEDQPSIWLGQDSSSIPLLQSSGSIGAYNLGGRSQFELHSRLKTAIAFALQLLAFALQLQSVEIRAIQAKEPANETRASTAEAE